MYKELLKLYKPTLNFFRFILNKTEDSFLKRLNINSKYHGLYHSIRVGIYSSYIAVFTGINTDLVLYASFFHDCGRINDFLDIDHGKRSSELWKEWALKNNIKKDVLFPVYDSIYHHNINFDNRDSLGHCLCNADRLDLIRMGIEIDPNKMYNDGIWQKVSCYNAKLLNDIRDPQDYINMREEVIWVLFHTYKFFGRIPNL